MSTINDYAAFFTESTLSLYVSGRKDAICVAGEEFIADIHKSVRAYLKNTTRPSVATAYVQSFDAIFFVDEFCITFLDWIRIHDCGVPDCEVGKQRNSFVDMLSINCAEQTVLMLDGIQPHPQAAAAQLLVNLLHQGLTLHTAKLAVQKETGVVMISANDKYLSNWN